MTDLCCFCTGSNILPPRRGDVKPLLVKFDGAIDLPLSETCILTMTIPSKHKAYCEFKKYFDIALKYGSSGFTFA